MIERVFQEQDEYPYNPPYIFVGLYEQEEELNKKRLERVRRAYVDEHCRCPEECPLHGKKYLRRVPRIAQTEL